MAAKDEEVAALKVCTTALQRASLSFICVLKYIVVLQFVILQGGMGWPSYSLDSWGFCYSTHSPEALLDVRFPP